MNKLFVYTEREARRRAASVPTYVDGRGRLYVSNQLFGADDPGFAVGTATLTVLLPQRGVGENEQQAFPVLSEQLQLWDYKDGVPVGTFSVIDTYRRQRSRRLHQRTIGVRLKRVL